jgi:DNA-binding response OmpR family regulator
MTPQILLVDDEPALRFGVAHYLAQAGCTVEGSSTLGEGCDRLQSRSFDALILDLILPDGNGLHRIAEFRKAHPELAIIVVSAMQEADVRQAAIGQGADEYFMKPVSLSELYRCLEATVAKKSAIGKPKARSTSKESSL